MDSMPLLEWLANNYKSYGAALEIVTDRSQEGAQFVRGFGGIGGIFSYIILIDFTYVLENSWYVILLTLYLQVFYVIV